MTDIEKARETIDNVDKKIAELFNQRMKAVEEVIKYKKENDLPIYDEKREQEVIEKNCKYIKDEEIRKYYIEVLNKMMEVSKKYQEKLK